MTPQERQLMAELFDRLASLENAPRDPEAEAAIREGWRRAPNAAYALVQTVLVQDEALKAANDRIQELEQQFGGPQPPQEQRGFLDSMRDNLFGREEPQRGSVPRVSQQGADPWGRGQPPGQGYGQPGYAQMNQGGPMQAPPQQGGGGSSFLGTAAATAAGVIGGSLLMNGIRSAMAGHQGSSPASKALEDLGGGKGEGSSPWSGSGNGDLSREAGLNDVAGSRGSGSGDYAQRTGLFGSDSTEGDAGDGYEESDDGDYFDDGDSEET